MPPRSAGQPGTEAGIEWAVVETPCEIFLNGEPRRLGAGSTVLDLLEQLGRDPRTVAVEHNGDLLPRAAYGETRLSVGDRLEVVHFVQGGSGRELSWAGSRRKVETEEWGSQEALGA
ncbi:MAG: sulfur carrier protein ThiS [Acidobacteriota bacterium]|nr:sulfur carrier protein ThiS [Acidobacteriota bacterium]